MEESTFFLFGVGIINFQEMQVLAILTQSIVWMSTSFPCCLAIAIWAKILFGHPLVGIMCTGILLHQIENMFIPIICKGTATQQETATQIAPVWDEHRCCRSLAPSKTRTDEENGKKKKKGRERRSRKQREQGGKERTSRPSPCNTL